jgi:hypothetical protein
MPEKNPIFAPTPEPHKRYARTFRVAESPESVAAKENNPEESWHVEAQTLRGVGKPSTIRYEEKPLEPSIEAHKPSKNPFEITAERVQLTDEQISKMIRAGLIEYGVANDHGHEKKEIPPDVEKKINHEVHKIETSEDLDAERKTLKDLVEEAKQENNKEKRDRFSLLKIEGDIFIVLSALGAWFIRNSWEKVDEKIFEAWCRRENGLGFDVGPHTGNLIHQAYETAKKLINKESKQAEAG